MPFYICPYVCVHKLRKVSSFRCSDPDLYTTSLQTLKSHPRNRIQSPMAWRQRRDVIQCKLKDGPVLCPPQAWPSPLHLWPGLSQAFELQQCSSELWEFVLKCSLSFFLKRSPPCWLHEGAFLLSSRPGSGSVLHSFANIFGLSCFARMLGDFRGDA